MHFYLRIYNYNQNIVYLLFVCVCYFNMIFITNYRVIK